jgi:hypothetical protein
MNSQKPTTEQLRRFAVSEDEDAFFRALVENPALEGYVAPFVGLHHALGLMSSIEMYGNCVKFGVHHPELLTEEAFELLGVLIEWQKDPVLKQNLGEVREDLRRTLDSGFDRKWAWEQYAPDEPWSDVDRKNYLAQRDCLFQILSIDTPEERTAFLNSFPEWGSLVEIFILFKDENIHMCATLLRFLNTEGYGSKWQILHEHPELLSEETIAHANALHSELFKLSIFSKPAHYRPPFDLLKLCKDKGIEEGLFDEIGRIVA